MIISRIRGPVGKWLFTDHQYVVSENAIELHRYLSMIQAVAEILEAHQLLYVTEIVLFDFIGYDPVTGARTAVLPEPDISVPLTREEGARMLVVRCEETLRQVEERRSFRFPVGIDVLGTGLIFDANGCEIELPDVTWLGCHSLAYHAVSVMTQSDAWLPYTLRAEPQEEVFLQNAPRLELAIGEIAQRLGIEPVTDRSDFAVMEDYYLDNHRDPDGDPEPAYLGDDDEYVRIFT